MLLFETFLGLISKLDTFSSHVEQPRDRQATLEFSLQTWPLTVRVATASAALSGMGDEPRRLRDERATVEAMENMVNG